MTVDELLAVMKLDDRTDRLALADAMEEAGRDEEAESLRGEGYELLKRDGRVRRFDPNAYKVSLVWGEEDWGGTASVVSFRVEGGLDEIVREAERLYDIWLRELPRKIRNRNFGRLIVIFDDKDHQIYDGRPMLEV